MDADSIAKAVLDKVLPQIAKIAYDESLRARNGVATGLTPGGIKLLSGDVVPLGTTKGSTFGS